MQPAAISTIIPQALLFGHICNTVTGINIRAPELIPEVTREMAQEEQASRTAIKEVSPGY